MAGQGLIKKKTFVRNEIKNSLSKFFVDINKIVERNDEKELDFVISIISTIENEFENLKVIHNEMIDLLEEEADIQKEVSENISFKREMQEYLNKGRSFINKVKAKDKSTGNTLNSNTENLSASNRTLQPNLKLPKIELPKFNGNPLNWKHFIDSFTCSIDQNSSISDIQKMTYLQSLLCDSAADTIENFALSSENYQPALELLKSRFGNDQVLISAHMNNLLKINPIKSLSNVTGLRKVYDNIESQIRSLNSLKIDSKQYGPLLIPILSSKIPQTLNLQISRTIGNGIWDINSVLKIFREEIEARERLNPVNDEKERHPQYSASSLFANSDKYKKDKKTKKNLCIFCDSNKHNLAKCNLVTDVNVRKNILKNKGRCFKCTKTNHVAKECKSNIKCFECGKDHHAAVCMPVTTDPQVPVVEDETNVTISTTNKISLLQTAIAEVFNVQENKSMTLRVLFDSGSQLSYITPSARKLLNLKTFDKQNLTIKTFGDQSENKTLDIVKLCMKGKAKDISVYINALVSEICSPLQGQYINLAQQKYEHLSDIQLADSNPDQSKLPIDILIGSDNYWKFMSGKIIKPKTGSGPVAVDTIFGHVLHGEYESNTFFTNFNETLNMKVVTELNLNEKLYDNLQKFWEVESVGIKEQEDVSVLTQFKKDLKFNEGRYEVKLPFQENFDHIEDNFLLSKNRLKTLHSKLKKDPKLLNEYDNIINGQLESGVIEKADNIETKVGQVHYLPHRAVCKPNRVTTKTRIVFDASAKNQDKSLNDMLKSGPSLTTSLFGALLRFRCFNYAMLADLEKAFLQISIHPDHRDFIRFLWFENIHEHKNFDDLTLIKLRFCRVLFGLTSSPFLLQATLVEHINKLFDLYPELVKRILDSFHVDDFVSGTDNIDEGKRFFLLCKAHLKKGSLNLTKFQSNSVELENSIYNETNEIKKIDANATTKVLGILWDKSNDVIKFEFDSIYQNLKNSKTKREIIQSIASIYDPLGIINPVVVTLKCFFQELCTYSLSWDETLPENILLKWEKIVTSFKSVESIILHRCYCFWLPNIPIISIELHGFSDASLAAYGACIYLLFVKKDGEKKCVLITSKSKVSPLKKQTIPRLELLGALLLANLLHNTKIELRNYKNLTEYAWIDSTVAYYWITNNKSYKPFIQNRKEKITKLITPNKWNLVNTKDNPADIVSRGSTPDELNSQNIWFEGPKFLYLSKNLWPKIISIADEELLEINTHLVTNSRNVNLSSLIQPENYSKMNRLLRVTAYVLKFIFKLKSIKVKNTEVAKFTVSRQNSVNTLNNISFTAADFTVSQPPVSQMSDKNVADFTVSQHLSVSEKKENDISFTAADFTVSQPPVSQTSDIDVANSTVSRHNNFSLLNPNAAEFTVSQQKLNNNIMINEAADSTVSRHGKYILRDRKKLTKINKNEELNNENNHENEENEDIPADNPMEQDIVEEVVEDHEEPIYQQSDETSHEMDTVILDNDIINTALQYWIKDIQQDLHTHKKYSQLSHQLRTFVDQDGIIRCEGRLLHADLPYDSKFPILLTRDSPFVSLLIQDAHHRVKHQGVNSTLAYIRTKYWIPQGKKVVRSIIHRCIICRRFNCKPYQYPEAPPLPEDRVSLQHPFKISGVDCLGPVYVKDIYINSSDVYKSWISLFTCASTRAIHLELVVDSSGPSFLNALKRFISTRGIPQKVISDNGPNFTAQEVQNYVSDLNINWTFNPPAAPWWGGFFERMVQMVKRCLIKVLFKVTLNFEEMSTVLKDIECTLNDRPLTSISTDISEGALTPNHLIHGKRLTEKSIIDNNQEVKDIKENMKHIDNIKEHFRNRWKREYLAELRERHRYLCHKRARDIVNIGDVVIIHDDKLKRSNWRLGIVDEVFKSRDNKIRHVNVKTTLNGKIRYLKRTINFLYPIEVNVQ